MADGHIFVGTAGQGFLSFGEACEHGFVDEMNHHDVARRIAVAHVTDDAFHAANAFPLGMVGILVIVYGKLDEKQIDWLF
ncbi:MAG: hypothetical protein KJS91_16875 [Planctomycetes bacterium]|nr:hypothetical protein [Planctomycetota bacterium]